MEEQTNKSNTKYSPLLVIGILLVILFIGFILIKPKTSPTPNLETIATPTQVVITDEELVKHSTTDNCWVKVDQKVYDVTKVIPIHKGGEKAITNWCGKDASEAFNTRGGNGPHPATAMINLEKLLMGIFEVKK